MKRLIYLLSLYIVILCCVSCSKKYFVETDFRVIPLQVGSLLEISEYVGNRQYVDIPHRIQGKAITSIGARAFRAKGIINVDIPNSVTVIKREAFQRNLLVSITIPNSVSTIESDAFRNNQLTEITIGRNVAIGKNAFDNDFRQVYIDGGHRAGTYRLIGSTWVRQ